MELKFLGRGSAFNPKEGNTSAYFIENNELFLIDCGSIIFKEIIELNLLQGIKKINVFITHTHTDHIGSLGTLIEYAYFTMKIKVSIIIEEDLKHIESIKSILTFSGVTSEMYNLENSKNFNNTHKTFSEVKYLETNHTETLNSYSLVFFTEDGLVFYSGDTNNLNCLKSILMMQTKIDKVYTEVTLDETSPVHLPLNRLINFLPENMKSKIYCMHLENDEIIHRVLEAGFNVVDTPEKKTRVIKKG